MKSCATQWILIGILLFELAVGTLAQDVFLSVDPVPEVKVNGLPDSARLVEWCNSVGGQRVWKPLSNVVFNPLLTTVTDLSVPPGENRFYRVAAPSPLPQTPQVDRLERFDSTTSLESQSFNAGVSLDLSISLVPALKLRGTPGTPAKVEWADALGGVNRWLLLTTTTLEEAPKIFIDHDVPFGGRRLYRIERLPAEPTGRPPGFAWIPAATFLMGTPDSEPGRGWEGPQTEVTISAGFWIGQHEVTQKEFNSVKVAHKSNWTGETLPVELVTWDEAVDYCAELTEQERKAGRLPAGYLYRLPTEAEWEYACRAGTTTRFSYGNDPDATQLENYAWFTGNSEAKTHPVGGKLPNPWGLYDMHGNVWEWCLDWYGALPGGRATDPQNLEPSFAGILRTVRGGCLANIAGGCRSGNRNGFPPDRPYYGIGLRLVLAHPAVR